MLWGLLMACRPGFGVIDNPQLETDLAFGVGVDPWTGQVWASRVEGDPALQQKVLDYEDVIGEEVSEAEAETLSELRSNAMDSTQLHLTQIDADSLVRIELRTMAYMSFPRAVFTETGPLLSLVVGSRRSFEDLSSGGTLKAHNVISSASGAWVLVESNGTQSIAPTDLQWTLALDTAVDFQFTGDGKLLGLKGNSLLVLQPPERSPERVVELLLPEGVEATGLRALSDTHALLTTALESGSSLPYVAELSTGITYSLKDSFRNGTLSADGQWAYADDADFVDLLNLNTLQYSRLETGEYGKSWISDDGRYLFFENTEGLGWYDLQTGAYRMNAERQLRRIVLFDDAVWNVDGQLATLDLSNGRWSDFDADCSPIDGAAMPDGHTLVLRCGRGDWLEPGDQELVLLDTRTNSVTARVSLD